MLSAVILRIPVGLTFALAITPIVHSVSTATQLLLVLCFFSSLRTKEMKSNKHCQRTLLLQQQLSSTITKPFQIWSNLQKKQFVGQDSFEIKIFVTSLLHSAPPPQSSFKIWNNLQKHNLFCKILLKLKSL
jgi:hypothetical protein